MAVWYCDYEGGNNANNGTSFAQRWKTINAATAAAGVAAGDTVRIMGSPAATSLGINGTWTDGPLQYTIAITSSTDATPISINTTVAHGLTTGDTDIITGHTVNTNANGTWTVTVTDANNYTLNGSAGTGGGAGGATGTTRKVNNCVITLASALTTNISSTTNRGEGRVAWTSDGGANVVCTLNTTDFKCADCSDSIAIGASFTTGLAAHFATGTLDLSTKQGACFWIKQTAGTVAVAGDYKLQLCTDTAGATGVHDLAIPALVALNRWVPIYVDLATNLNSAIKSCNFTVVTDRGAVTFLISNLIAVKAAGNDNLNLTSLIGKNTAGETFVGIQSINGTRAMMDRDTNCLPTTPTYLGYVGTSETVTAYKRETIKTTPSVSGGFPQTVQLSGSAGSLVAFEGGYDRTDMTTQNLETWFDGQNSLGDGGFYLNGKSYCSFNRLAYIRYNMGVYFYNSYNNQITTLSAANNNGTYGVAFSNSYNNQILTGSTSSNMASGVFINAGCNFFRNFTINEATKVSGWNAYANGRVNVQAPAGTVHQYCDGGDITYDLTKWTLSPTNTRRNANYPLTLQLAQIPVKANLAVTFTALVNRDNVGLALRLVCKGRQLSGIASDVVATAAAGAGSDETLTLGPASFTPTEQGVLAITVEAYGGTTYNGLVKSITFSQA